jgi:hypothetical protein
MATKIQSPKIMKIELILGLDSIFNGFNSNMQNNPKTWKYPIFYLIKKNTNEWKFQFNKNEFFCH